MSNKSAAINPNLTAAKLTDIFATAMQAAREDAMQDVSDKYHGGCGFAYVAITMRKNGRLHRELIAHGWRWYDYYKQYRFGPHNALSGHEIHTDFWQSEWYQYSICNAFANVLNEMASNVMLEAGRIDRLTIV